MALVCRLRWPSGPLGQERRASVMGGPCLAGLLHGPGGGRVLGCLGGLGLAVTSSVCVALDVNLAIPRILNLLPLGPQASSGVSYGLEERSNPLRSQPAL